MWPPSKFRHPLYLHPYASVMLPTAAARVRTRVWSDFLRVLRFPLPIFIPPIAPQSPSSIIWGLYNRPEVAAVPRDLVSPTPH
jgi:hypothetical protein